MNRLKSSDGWLVDLSYYLTFFLKMKSIYVRTEEVFKLNNNAKKCHKIICSFSITDKDMYMFKLVLNIEKKKKK